MIRTKKALMVALLFPILVLAALTAYREYVLSTGKEIILPISGYDPRDLLSGHYLTYQIEYGVDGICASNSTQNQALKEGYICLEPKQFSYSAPKACSTRIRGICHGGRFEAGIEKYYVPEDNARKLETLIRSKTTSIMLSVTPDGQAQVKDLLINGRSWKSQ